jgi:tetratricopeptide (TPR) repeat protein
MSKQTIASFFIRSPSLAKSAELYQVLLRGIDNYWQLGHRLTQLAEQAHAFRQFDKLKELAFMLSNIPIKDYQAVGNYFLAVATNRKGAGNQEEAQRRFELAVDTAPDAYKAKASSSLGAMSARRSDFDAAYYHYREAVKIGKLSATGLHAIKAISVLKALEGDHPRALKDLENILPVLKYTPPHIHFDILNSLAVELAEAGRKPEARDIARTVMASPFAFAYPEWRETAETLKVAKRSSVVMNLSPAPPPNVLIMPIAEPDRRPSVAAWSPAPVVDLQKWKAKMRQGKNSPRKQNRDVITEKDMLVRLMEIFTHDETTEDQRRKIWEAAETIAAAAQQPESDDTQGA